MDSPDFFILLHNKKMVIFLLLEANYIVFLLSFLKFLILSIISLPNLKYLNLKLDKNSNCSSFNSPKSSSNFSSSFFIVSSSFSLWCFGHVGENGRMGI